MTVMRNVTLGKTGLRVSAVGFGGIPIQRLSEDEAVDVIRRSLDLGVTFIDTAAGYGDSQAKIGKAIEGRREGLVLATKSGRKDKQGILDDIERARRELGADVIDLFQFHGVSKPGDWDKISAPEGALAGVLEARDKGHLTHIGFSSHSLEVALKLVEEPVFETLQFPFNLVTSEPAQELIPKCRELGLGFIVMKPLCGGQYDNARLAFKFLNAYPDLAPIPGIETAGQIEEIVNLVASGETLTGDERTEAEEIANSLGKRFCRRCGYCEPCPEGVPIQLSMIFDSFCKRMPEDKVAAGPARKILEQAPGCVECGECEEKCPYDLPIVESIKTALGRAGGIVAQA
jgi:predicted aldo/keto reductase-like oxidoreductase